MAQVLTETFEDLEELVENLVTEDDAPVNIFAAKQQRLLTQILYSSWTLPNDDERFDSPQSFFVTANVGLFYSPYEPPLVPDVLLSLGVTAPADMHSKRNRSYLVWVFKKLPDAVIEIVSNKEGGELTNKLRDYARIGIRYYVVFDPKQLLSQDVLRVYEPGLVNRYFLRNDFQLPSLELSLTLWHGEFEGTKAEWLRWTNNNGELLPTPDEKVLLERARADQEKTRAEQETQLRMQVEERMRLLEAKLRESGVDPNEI